MTCSVRDCARTAPFIRGMCRFHYHRWWRTGRTDRRTAQERFFGFVEITPTDCWAWKGATDHLGYARFHASAGVQLAHRLAYEWFVGPIPAGLEIDHVCRNRRCVNPAHLEAVTHRENVLRGASAPGGATHCPRGHVYDVSNTHIAPSGDRRCRRCNNDRNRAKYWERKQVVEVAQ
jgi:hypothetical protein